MATAALIPARGGSKRLPRKNILDLGGKPMLAYPIQAALTSGLFDQVYVSTEDAEIAEVAERHGAAIIKRPAELAADRSTVVDVCVHALETFPPIDLLCCIYATAVLLKPESIVAGYRIMRDQVDTDFVMGVSEYEHPPVQALKEGEGGYLSYMWPEWKGVQSQFHPRLSVSNGAVYWARRQALLKQRTFYGKRLKGLHIPAAQVSDIDTQQDLDELRLKLNKEARL